jgi:hypothetical protein
LAPTAAKGTDQTVTVGLTSHPQTDYDLLVDESKPLVSRCQSATRQERGKGGKKGSSDFELEPWVTFSMDDQPLAGKL